MLTFILKKHFNCLLLIFGVLIFSSSFAQSSFSETEGWISCYNATKNKLYFKSTENPYENHVGCDGETSYQAAKNSQLIKNLDSTDIFSGQRAGTKRTLLLKNGRRLLVSQWNKPGKANQIIILEPNLKTRKVRKHCTVTNFKDAFSVRYDKKSKKMRVLVTVPKSKTNQKLRKVWKTCRI